MIRESDQWCTKTIRQTNDSHDQARSVIPSNFMQIAYIDNNFHWFVIF